MANIKSAKKRVLTSATKHDRNRSVRAAIKTRVTRVRHVLDTGEAEAAEPLRLAVSSLDRAAEKGILHPNNAARRKSRLIKAVARAQALAADPEAKARAAAEAKAHAKGTSKNRGKTTAAKKAAAKKAATTKTSTTRGK
jgi:small subunit ribosomal protein S20